MTCSRESISITKDWNTPPEYIDIIKKFFGRKIDLDPCSNEYSLVDADVSYQLPQNGLELSWWFPTIFVNPPYGRDKQSKTTIRHWIQKCYTANNVHKSEVIALIPVATNTKHWQDIIFKTASCICFLKVSRLKFDLDGQEYKKGAPMACCLVYWGHDRIKFEHIFKDLGKVVRL